MEEPVKRKRGRPRKNPLPEEVEAVSEEVPSTEDSIEPEVSGGLVPGNVSYLEASRIRQENAIANNTRATTLREARRQRNRRLAREVALIGRINKAEMLAKASGDKAEEAKAEADKLAEIAKEVQAEHAEAEKVAAAERAKQAEAAAVQLEAAAAEARQEAENLKNASSDD